MGEDVRSKKNKVTDHTNHYLKSDSEKESDAAISKRVTEFKRLTKERLYFIWYATGTCIKVQYKSSHWITLVHLLISY